MPAAAACKLGNVLLEADSAAQVLVEHDVHALDQVSPFDGQLGRSHPRQVGPDDARPLEIGVRRAVQNH